MFKDFKEFIKRGNVMDLAVGVIIGAAFGKIVSSLTDDILMPIIGKVAGGADFSNYFIALDGKSYPTLAEAKKATAVLAYGNLITTVVDFLLIAFVIFLLVKQVQRIMPPPPPPPPAGPSPTETLLGEIRDILKKKA